MNSLENIETINYVNCESHEELTEDDRQYDQKVLKAFEIIKNKEPRINYIKSMIRDNSVDYTKYQAFVYDYEQLTEEEFNLVVEMLGERRENENA